MLTWPHEDTDWAAQLDAVETLYVTLCSHILAAQQVLLVCRDAAHRRHIRNRLRRVGLDSGALIFALADSNDSWTRDHGPLACVDGKRVRLLDFRFNGWGEKFPAELDDQITQTLYRRGLFPTAALLQSRLVLEGGAIDTDGAGTLLATRSSLFSEFRNPGLPESQILNELGDRLGFKRFLLLEHGRLSGDDTDSHIDILARFCNRETLCHVTCDTPGDPDYEPLARMQSDLKRFTAVDGVPYALIPLPSPQPKFDENGKRLPASYANFLIINGAVLVPVYQDPADELACRRLQDAFPSRRIVPIDCDVLIRQNGSLHCITMQFPAQLELQAT